MALSHPLESCFILASDPEQARLADLWRYFPHSHARSRAYRWGEDGLLGITDRDCRLCFALALWNERDVILKERLFGLSGPEGNHGEDVKECYYYLDLSPTHSYVKTLYKYPQRAFPYDHVYGDTFTVECPTGSGRTALVIRCLVSSLGDRPVHRRSQPMPMHIIPDLEE